MADSLNAWVTHEEDIPPFEEILEVDTNPIDITVEVDSSLKLDAALEDLLYLHKDLLNTNGMCKSFAVEAQKLVPNFDNNNPISYYTEAPSATRYKLAVEEISNGLWALIAAGIAALMAIIYKIVKWLTGKKGDKSDDNSKPSEETIKEQINEDLKKSEETAVAANDLGKVVEEVEQEIKQNGILIPSRKDFEKGHEVKNPDEVFEYLLEDSAAASSLKEFLSKRDPIVDDAITNGEYTKSIYFLVNIIPVYLAATHDKIKALSEAINKDINGKLVTDEMKIDSSLGANGVLNKEIKVPFNGGEKSGEEIYRAISEQRNKVVDKSYERKTKLRDLLKDVERINNDSKFKNLIQIKGEVANVLLVCHDELDKIESKLKNLNHDNDNGEVHHKYGSAFRTIQQNIRSSLIPIAHFQQFLSEYQNKVEFLGNAVQGYAQRMARQLDSLLDKTPEDKGTDVTPLKKLAKSIKELGKEAKGNLKGMFYHPDKKKK